MTAKFFTSAFLALLLSGCTSMFEPEPINENESGLYEKVYFASYEQVWRAAQLALAKYSMRINNMDSGLLQTEMIGGSRAWKPPGSKKRIPNALQYSLVVNVIKGRSLSNPAVKVVIEKKMNMRKSFFSEAKELVSDGLEEAVVGYRIGRILTIERAIESALKEAEDSSEGSDQSETEYF